VDRRRTAESALACAEMRGGFWVLLQFSPTTSFLSWPGGVVPLANAAAVPKAVLLAGGLGEQ